MNDSDIWLAGVDGCPAGWIVAFVRADLREARVRLMTRFIDVPAAPEAPAIIAIDIPIGLPERAGHGGRAPPDAGRPPLRPRPSPGFFVAAPAPLPGVACRPTRRH